MEYNSTPWKDILIDTRDYTVYKDKKKPLKQYKNATKPHMAGVMNG